MSTTETAATPAQPTFWTTDADAELLTCETIEDAVDEFADWSHPDPLPEEVVVHGFVNKAMHPKTAEWLQSHLLEQAMEYLDEEYGSAKEATEPAGAVVQAAEAFVAVVLEHYKVWQCERVETRTVKVADYYTPGERDEVSR